MKVTLPKNATTKNSPALRFLGLPCLAVLLMFATTLHAAVPADPVVEMRFPEGTNGAGGAGVITTNTGTLAGNATFAQPVDPIYETNLAPIFWTNVPAGPYVPAGNDYSLDMGFEVIGNSFGGSHGRAVDLVTDFGPSGGTVGAFPQITVCGWLNTRSYPGQVGGARIAYALETAGGLGFDMLMRIDGTLALTINENNTGSPQSAYQVPLDANAGSNNWVYFAATYDPSLPSGQLKYYFGSHYKLASLDVARDYAPATISLDFTGPLTVGNLGSNDGLRDAMGGQTRFFRGFIDEVKVYTNALTIDEIQQAQLNSAVTPVGPTILRQPVSATATVGQNATFSVDTSGSGLVTYQWKTNGVNVAGATNPSVTLNSVVLAQNGNTVLVGVTNSVGGLLSSNVTLTVIPADPHVVSLSFTENSGTTTTNVGSLAGWGRFLVSGGSPRLISTNVPTGPFAPSAVHNPTSLFMGTNGANRAVDVTNTLVSPAGALGSMNRLTICGWLNSANATFRTTSTGRGTAVLNASKGGSLGGFILGYRNNSMGLPYGENGRLQLHVNEFAPDSAGHVSSVDTIPLSSNSVPANWVFFAVTYDGTLTTANLNYYFGDPNNAATNDVLNPLTYNKGIIADTGPLTVGNDNGAAGNPTGRTVGEPNGRAFRGLMDEIKVFTRVLSLAEIQAEQIAPAAPTLLVYSNSGPNLDLSWETRSIFSYQLQSRTNLATGSWLNVTNSESVSGNIHTVPVPRSQSEVFFRITR